MCYVPISRSLAEMTLVNVLVQQFAKSKVIQILYLCRVFSNKLGFLLCKLTGILKRKVFEIQFVRIYSVNF